MRVAPFTIRTVVFPYVQRVRVAPFTETRTVTPPCEWHDTPWGPYEHCPPPYTETVAVFNYVERPVYGDVDVFNYETRDVFNYDTRSVFNYDTLTEDVFNYDTRSVFNYDTLTEDVFNYDTRRRWVDHDHGTATPVPSPTPCPYENFNPETGECWETQRPGTTATPLPRPTTTATATATATPAATATATATPAATATATATATPAATATATPAATATVTATAVPPPRNVTAECSHGGRRVTVRFNGVSAANAYTVSGFPGGTQTVRISGAGLKRAVFAGGISPGIPYDVSVRAVNSEGDTSVPSSIAVTCKSPTPWVSYAVCNAEGELSVSWVIPGVFARRRQFEVEVDGEVVGTVLYTATTVSESFDWDGAHSNKAHRVRVRMVSTPLGVHLGENAESNWSVVKLANTCNVFKPTGLSGSCSSHGVVHLDWDPVNGADRYDVNYPSVGHRNPDPNTDSIRYEGPATEVYAQRWEGETYKFRVRARAQVRQQWSGWTEAVTVVCDPFYHRQLEPSGHDTDRSVSWTSPNYKVSAHDLDRHPHLHSSVSYVRHNPIHVRYMTDEANDPALGRDNCSTTQRNEDDDGWTRTCTINWTEPLAIELDKDVVSGLSHISGWIHDDGTDHVYLDADGVLVSTPHRHCAGDGTCSDDTDVPDLAWHPDMPDPDDDFWQNTLTDSGITGLGGGLAGPVVAAALGLSLGAGIAVGVVVGIGVNVVYAWLSRDDDIVFIIDGYHGCLETSLSESNSWVQKELLSPIEETFEEGGYETVVKHEIFYCERNQPAG